MAEDMEQQVNAIFQPKAKVFCSTCFYYVPAMVTQQTLLAARCRHPNARYRQATFEGLVVVSMPPEQRNAQNTCEDWTRRTFFSDLGHNPFKLLMVVLAMLVCVVMLGKVFVP